MTQCAHAYQCTDAVSAWAALKSLAASLMAMSRHAVLCSCARGTEPLIEDMQAEMRSLEAPLVRAAIAAVSLRRPPSAEQTAVAEHRHTASKVTLWQLACDTVDVWADSANDIQLRDFLQVSMVAMRNRRLCMSSKPLTIPWPMLRHKLCVYCTILVP